MGARLTQAQLEALVDFLEQNPELARGLLRTQHGKQQVKKKWNKLAPSINALGVVVKDGRGWSKYWAERKCTLKKFCAQQALSIQRNGGATLDLPRLTPLELRLVATMGEPSFPSDPLTSMESIPKKTERQSISEDREVVGSPPSPVNVRPNSFAEEPQALEANESSPHNIGATTGAPSSRGRARVIRRSRSQLGLQFQKLLNLERRRLAAESRASEALANGIDNLTNAIREGSQAVANALLQIARKLPPSQ